MRTPYSTQNAEDSNKAHMAARSLIYPKIFDLPADKLEFEDTLLHHNERGMVLDGEMAIDRIVNVTARQELKQPVIFTVQERFRKPKFARYKDLTITEWNNNSNLPSELYKITANLFVYGYFDGANFLDFVCANVPAMLAAICNGNLPLSRGLNPRSNQSFITMTFSDLHRLRCLMFWDKAPEETQASLFD